MTRKEKIMKITIYLLSSAFPKDIQKIQRENRKKKMKKSSEEKMTDKDQELADRHLPRSTSRFEESQRRGQDPSLPMRPGDPSQMADALMHDLEAIRRCRRRQRQPIDEETGRPRGRAQSGSRNQAEPEITPLTQLCMHLSSLTSQVRQLRHIMTSLNHSVQENSDYLEEVIDGNERLVDEFKDVDA